MTRAEKARRMELRRDIGNRQLPQPLVRSPTSNYRIAHACFKCRVSFKRRPRDSGVRCPSCGGPAYEMGRAFKAPASGDIDQWRKVQALYAYGFRFVARGGSQKTKLPASYKEVASFAVANPIHPDRVAAFDPSLLPTRHRQTHPARHTRATSRATSPRRR